MKIFFYSVLAATLCAAPAMAQVNAQPRPMAPRPTDVAGQIKQDLSALARAATQEDGYFSVYPYIYDARYGYFGAFDWARQLNRLLQDSEIQIESVRVLNNSQTDARAVVDYKIVPDKIYGDEKRKFWSDMHQETIDLKFGANPSGSSHAVWRIVPPQTAPPEMDTSEFIAKHNVLLANIAYGFAQKQMPEIKGTPAERSMDNLRKLGLCAEEFAQDYDDVYAFGAPYYREALAHYIRQLTVFQTPELFLVPNTNEIYTFNGNISGLNTDEVKAPAQTVLFYEGQNETPIFRYDGKAAICFADGHVALVSPNEAKNLIWKP